jgi:hypothetical protein
LKDVNTPLRKAYVDAISAMTYNGSTLKVYDGIVADSVVSGKEEYLYVLIADQTDNDSVRTKTMISHDSTIMVQVYNGVMGGAGRKKVDEVAALILNAVNSVTSSGFLNLSASNLDIVTTTVISDVTDLFSTKSHKVWRRNIRFRHNISE